MSGSELERWLTNRVASITGVNVTRIDRNMPFESLGLDSVLKVSLTVEIEQQVQRSLDSDLLYTYNTIATLINALGANGIDLTGAPV